jgi:tripartite-type tricarboxylate transporter receptor subunit TctC
MIQSGRVKLLGATSTKRSEVLKDVPTLAEQGYPGFEALAWNGLFAPAGTPAELVRKIAADVDAVLRDPAVREALAKQGLVAGGGTPAEFAAFIEAESRKWGAIIRDAGITLD